MTKINEVAEHLIELGDVTVETKGGGATQIPDGVQNQFLPAMPLAND